MTRSGASVGDVVAHAGQLGLSSRGLEELLAPGSNPRVLRETSEAVAWHVRPTPPIHLGPVAALHGATAMMDVSDGLLIDARRMARASGVAMNLEGTAIPDRHALTGGEDHGLLACFPGNVSLPDGFVALGRVVEAGDNAGVVMVDGVVSGSGAGGWDPYRRTTT